MNNPINETMRYFYLSTHIPMRAYNINGEIISSVAYKKEWDEMLNANKIFGQVRNELFRNDQESFTNVNIDDLTYTATYICCKKPEDGIFIMGPYSTCSCNRREGILYKPSDCIPHLVSLLHNIKRDFIPSGLVESNTKETSYSPLIRRAIEYINDEYSNPITLDDITANLKINRCYFCTLFKKEVNKTFSQYLNEVRIERSKEMLLKNDLNILEIALSIGFNNPNYYSMVFKKLTNKTPLQYRREQVSDSI